MWEFENSAKLSAGEVQSLGWGRARAHAHAETWLTNPVVGACENIKQSGSHVLGSDTVVTTWRDWLY